MRRQAETKTGRLLRLLLLRDRAVPTGPSRRPMLPVRWRQGRHASSTRSRHPDAKRPRLRMNRIGAVVTRVRVQRVQHPIIHPWSIFPMSLIVAGADPASVWLAKWRFFGRFCPLPLRKVLSSLLHLAKPFGRLRVVPGRARGGARRGSSGFGRVTIDHGHRG